MADPVLPLDSPLAREATLTGAKGARLAALRSLGFPVPAGVVLTTDVYDAVVDDPAIRALRDELDDADEAARDGVAADLRAAIEARPLPDDVWNALSDALPDGPYAVRSSATSEDLPEASFAGQYETALGVDAGAPLRAAVASCLASLFTERAVAYRARSAVPNAEAAMAVVVQTVVDPDVSGVLFTADPLTGERDTAVVDAVPGRGDRYVTGKAAPDTARVDRRTGAVAEYALGAGRTEPLLGERDAVALATVGGRIEDALGSPQDVEWALADGDVYVLQARPVTALYPLPEPAPTDGRVHVYYSFGHRQGMPEAMPPLALDVWGDEAEVVRRRFGLSQRYAATAGGRLYVDMTAYLGRPWLRRRVLSNFDAVDAPGAAALRALLESSPEDFPLRAHSPGDAVRSLEALGRTLPALGTLGRSLPGALATARPNRERERIRRYYDTRCERALAAVRSEETVSARLTAMRDELRDAVGWLLETFYGPFVAAVLAGALLRRLVPAAAAEVDALALGAEGDVTAEMTRALGRLADVARETPAVEAALRDGADVAALRELDDAEAFLDALDAFLDEYGFRAVGEIDFSRPRYREDPRPLLNVLAGALEAGGASEYRETRSRLAARARRAERALRREAGPLRRPLVAHLARTYRGYLGLRELPKFALSRLLAELRRQVLDAADALVARDAIPSPDDVWLLTFDEVVDGVADPRTLVGIDLDGRRRQFGAARRVAAPRVVASDGRVPRGETDAAASGSVLRGTGVAPGVVEGMVRVVTDPSAARLERGEILVAPYTDPGWTPLFLNAAGVVTEVGGRLTHGALVAREYGLPAVSAVDGATASLTTGERVRVDGTRGTVERL